MNLSVQLRHCIPGDESALSLIGQATFLETFAGVVRGKDIVAHCERAHSAAVYREWLATSAYKLWLAEVSPGDAPVGYMVVAPPQLPLPDLAATDVELKRVYILRKFQGNGLGARFLAEVRVHAKQCGATRLLLGVYANNHSAIGFYERMGFQKIGERKFDVGGQGYDDIIMGMAL